MISGEQYQCLDCHGHSEDVSRRDRVFTAADAHSCPWCGGRSVVPVVEDPGLTTDEARAVADCIEQSLSEHDHSIDEDAWLNGALEKLNEVQDD